MNYGLSIRAAQAGDASFASSMIYLSMASLADHLFQQNTDFIEATIAKLFVRDAGRFGCKHAYVAEFENELVGLLVASRGDEINRFNLLTIPHLIAVLGVAQAIGFVYRTFTLPGGKEAEDDEFFISNLGILPSMQGNSFGTKMLVYAEELARANDLMRCSLIVGWHNTQARRLYERIGYRIVETVRDGNENLGYYRMVKVL
ncbi:MAG TPA: GNAT family N-acetyltransferase [Anaerolineales bacterium]